MSVDEQNQLKEKYHSGAAQYLDNAREYLKNAQKEGNYYRDIKYVRTACGTAYNGVLMALDCFLILKGIHKPAGKEKKSIEYYQKNLGKLDRKMLDYLMAHIKSCICGVIMMELKKQTLLSRVLMMSTKSSTRLSPRD